MSVRPPENTALRADERALLDRVVADFAPRLRAYVQRAFPAVGDAEDVVAEAVVRAARNIAAWQGREHPEFYLFTIVRNICLDRRRRRPEPPARSEAWLAGSAAKEGEPDEIASRREQQARVQAAVTELPEHLREVIVLRYSAGLKFEEIAGLLAIPLGTALSRGHAALKHLRKRLESSHEPRAFVELSDGAAGTAARG